MGTPLRFVHLDGVGLAPVRRILEKAPLQHGATDRGFRLDPRKLTLLLYIEGIDEQHADRLRDQIAYLFGPTDAPLTLRATRDDGEVRQIDCHVDGEVDFAMSQRVGRGQRVVIPLVAADPTWYETEQQVANHAITNGTTHLDITATGATWEDWPVIDITGPLNTSFGLRHENADSWIFFSEAIPAGQTFRLDFRPGYKTVKRVSDGANRISYVSPEYLLGFSEFKIMHPKQAAANAPSLNGANRLTFQATGTSGASSATIRWYRRFLSL
jgi:hypothetical protein